MLDDIAAAANKIHHADINSLNHNDEAKRLSSNCFREAIRCVNQLRQLLKAMEALGIEAAVKSNKKDTPHNGLHRNLSYPAYISIDLGLRQKRKHYAGRMYFQAILLQNDFFRGDGVTTTNPFLNGKSIRIAEGGRYDDLVRQVSVECVSDIISPLCLSLFIVASGALSSFVHQAILEVFKSVNTQRQKCPFVQD